MRMKKSMKQTDSFNDVLVSAIDEAVEKQHAKYFNQWIKVNTPEGREQLFSKVCVLDDIANTIRLGIRNSTK